jgi:hypothetical protein
MAKHRRVDIDSLPSDLSVFVEEIVPETVRNEVLFVVDQKDIFVFEPLLNFLF